MATTSALAAAQPAATPPQAKPATPAEARKAAKEFESFFLSQMMQPMFEGIETDGLFGGGHGEEMFRSMLLDEYGKQMARSGKVGLAPAIERAMLSMQEVQE